MTGILALQGAFFEHEKMLAALGEPYFEIRNKEDLCRGFDRLILPGGESTVMHKLLKELDLYMPLKERIKDGMPVFGTCAGLILLAKEVDGGIPCFGSMSIAVKRNAYGRQLGSFHVNAHMEGVGEIPMTFIRAPYIARARGDAFPLAVVEGRMVAAKEKNMLVCAFHPELDENPGVHAYFLRM